MTSIVQPKSICIFRLSALGDVTHVLPLIHTIRAAWPEVSITWIIGVAESKLLKGVKDVEFVVYNKRSGLAGVIELKKSLSGRKFDVLLQMQLSFRANLLSSLISADLKVGFDKARSKELHSLFINRRITPGGTHVLDVFGKFAEFLGLKQTQVRWDFPITDEARAWAKQQLPGDQPTLVISPCSSHEQRNWMSDRYAHIADYASEKNWRVVLSGGRSTLEREVGDQIKSNMKFTAIDLIGKDTLEQLPALLEKSTLLLSPDTGPVHIANAVGTPVLGLYACTNSRRSGPYSDQQWCVDHYADAARKFMGKEASELQWGRRVEFPGVMELITVNEVLEQFERFNKTLLR